MNPANPMICRSGNPLYWRAVEVDGLWHAELGITGVLSGNLRWERVGAPKDNKPDAEKTAVDFALIRAGRL
jgi:hypothetical protein